MNKIRIAAVVAIVATLIGSQAGFADVIQGFDGAAGTGAATFSGYISNNIYSSYGPFDDALNVSYFGGSGWGQSVTNGNASALIDGGALGSGDHAIQVTVESGMEYNSGSNFWFMGFALGGNQPTHTEPEYMWLSADFLAPAGAEYQLRLKAPGSTGAEPYYYMNGVGDGTWQTLGGYVSDFTLVGDGSFHDSSSNVDIHVNTANEWDSWAGGDPDNQRGQFIIDNVQYYGVIPEPGTTGLILLGLVVARVIARRTKNA